MDEGSRYTANKQTGRVFARRGVPCRAMRTQYGRSRPRQAGKSEALPPEESRLILRPKPSECGCLADVLLI